MQLCLSKSKARGRVERVRYLSCYIQLWAPYTVSKPSGVILSRVKSKPWAQLDVVPTTNTNPLLKHMHAPCFLLITQSHPSDAAVTMSSVAHRRHKLWWHAGYHKQKYQQNCFWHEKWYQESSSLSLMPARRALNYWITSQTPCFMRRDIGVG